MESNVILRAEGIKKQFPGVLALNDVHFELHQGEVHALCGENGAGKSTLLKILTGLYTKTEGEIFIDGQPADIKNLHDARKYGIYVIPQEMHMEPDLTVAENVFISGYPKTKFGLIDWKYMESKTRELQNVLGEHVAAVNPRTKVGRLSMGYKQLIEIMRSMTMENVRILAFDEPTSSLSSDEVKQLFDLIRQFKAKGISIIYVSHRLEEIFNICDRVTVFRDGKYIDTKEVSTIKTEDIIKMMVGRDLNMFGDRKDKAAIKNEVVFEIKDFTRSTTFRDISMYAKKGEIVGLFGIVGSGRTETMRAVFGLDPKEKGQVFVKGKKINITRPEVAKRHGIGFVTEDRRKEGLLLDAPIKWSISMTNMRAISNNAGLLNMRKEANFAEKNVEEFNIKTSSINTFGGNLSGGNQQKVIIAKWVSADCDILIFDEPTRGIDVGAKAEIYRRLKQLALEGKAIIMVSSELPEIIGLSDRIYVFKDGKIAAELDNEMLQEVDVLKFAISR